MNEILWKNRLHLKVKRFVIKYMLNAIKYMPNIEKSST